ncbi:MAG: hypothetical protein IJY28_00550 [Clostridia bacterium]|nr:hypothetical protein [Clostridia bacterium]
MNRAELKQFLQSYRTVCDENKQLAEQLARLRVRLESPGGGSDGMPHGSGVHDRVGDGIGRLDALQARYRTKAAEANRMKAQICQLIAPLSQMEQRLMYDRYIHGLQWAYISKRLHYSERHIKRLHGNILHKLSDDEA